MREIETIGIIGAGKLGITLARIARHYGFAVNIAGSGEPNKIALTAEVLAPGSRAMTSEDVARQSDVIILALPLGKFRSLLLSALTDKLVIDAMNHWWEVDGDRDGIIPAGVSSSEAVQEYFSSSRVVKAFNHIGYHDLFDEHRSVARKAVAIAGNDEYDVTIVAKLVDTLGFDPVIIGLLHEGRKLEPGTKVFGVSVDKLTLTTLLEA